MSSSPDKNAALTPMELNAILGLEDAPVAPVVAPMFRPRRAGEPAFELESRRDTALANALYAEARRMKTILDRAAMPERDRLAAEESHALFMRALLDFLRYAGTDD